MTIYRLTRNNGFQHCNIDNSILLGHQLITNLTQDEQIIFFSDCLIHEHIHKVLYEMFGDAVSSLFDAVGHLFRDYDLHVKVLECFCDRITWKRFIEIKGFKGLLEHYQLNFESLIYARLITQKRDMCMDEY